MDLKESIKQHEGYVGIVYKDSLGIDTIGYGFAIKDLELDEDICDMILDRKLKDLESMVRLKFDWFKYMPPEIKEVVMEMCYQLGVTGVSKFKKMFKALKQEPKNYKEAADQMMDSRWAKQTYSRARNLSDKMRKTDAT